jgi:hypothetical protein
MSRKPRQKAIAGQRNDDTLVTGAGDTKGAASGLNPDAGVRPSSPIAGQSGAESQTAGAGKVVEGAGVHVQPIGWLPPPPPPPPPHITELIEWQRRRVHAIRAQSQCDRSCDAYVSRYLGYHSGLPKAERLALMKQAAKMRADVEKSRGRLPNGNHGTGAPDATDGEGYPASESQNGSALAACLPIIVNTIQSRAGWDALRADAERRMREIARSLPVWPRCETIAGFGDLGLACIIAEAGNDLGAYPHYYHLWKRLGLAPFKGKAMSSFRGNELSKVEWSALGYSPMRRGRMAGDVGSALFFAKGRNEYGAVYADRRERTALTHPDWTPAHSDADARRIMLKALVADLWRWWREAAAVALEVAA